MPSDLKRSPPALSKRWSMRFSNGSAVQQQAVRCCSLVVREQLDVGKRGGFGVSLREVGLRVVDARGRRFSGGCGLEQEDERDPREERTPKRGEPGDEQSHIVAGSDEKRVDRIALSAGEMVPLE